MLWKIGERCNLVPPNALSRDVQPAAPLEYTPRDGTSLPVVP